MTTISPFVTLSTANASNTIVPQFVVNVAADTFNSPTGDNVFAQSGVGFWNSDRRLRLDFHTLISQISIIFAGGNNFGSETGRLDVFNSSGGLLSSYTTAPLGYGIIEDMVVSRSQADIAYAIAFIPPGSGSFGRLDNLRFITVPEPSAALLMGFGFSILIALRRK